MRNKEIQTVADLYERAADAAERLNAAEEALVMRRHKAKELLDGVHLPETVDALLTAFSQSDPPEDLVPR